MAANAMSKDTKKGRVASYFWLLNITLNSKHLAGLFEDVFQEILQANR